MHGIAIGGVVLFVVIMAVVARFALAGVGPFEGTVAGAVPDADGLAVTLSVTNQGNSAGQTTCRVTDPADRTGNVGGFMLSPQIEPGQTLDVHAAADRAGHDRSPARGRVQLPVRSTATEVPEAPATRRRPTRPSSRSPWTWPPVPAWC